MHFATSASPAFSAADGAGGPAAPDDGAATALWTTVTLRPTDVDDVGHVNNVVFAALTAAGRVDFIAQRLMPFAVAGSDFWLIRVEIDYLRQLFYPGTVMIGTTVTRVGRTSLTLGHELRSATESVARATSVLVHVDKASGRSMPLPDGIGRALSAGREAS